MYLKQFNQLNLNITLKNMKKLILLIPFLILYGCMEPAPQYTATYALQNCVTQRWDTVTITFRGSMHIQVARLAVPTLYDENWDEKALNVCNFKLIPDK